MPVFQRHVQQALGFMGIRRVEDTPYLTRTGMDEGKAIIDAFNAK